LNVVPKIDFWESLHEFKNVLHAVVVFFEVLVPHIVVDSVGREVILRVNVVTEADHNIYGDLGVRINNLLASLHS
jgi:hypothetical protein